VTLHGLQALDRFGADLAVSPQFNNKPFLWFLVSIRSVEQLQHDSFLHCQRRTKVTTLPDIIGNGFGIFYPLG